MTTTTKPNPPTDGDMAETRARPWPISDAEPRSWELPKRPDPTPAELRLGTAARRFATAADALERHVAQGLPQGPEYQVLLDVRDLRLEELKDAAWGFPAGYGEGGAAPSLRAPGDTESPATRGETPE
jgi:hypothetical protein